ncbi:MAG: beta strand repeat-containing protein, partial [Dolichospermum sp.]
NTGNVLFSGNNTFDGGMTLDGTSTGRASFSAASAFPTSGTITINNGGGIRFTAGSSPSFGGVGQSIICTPNQTTTGSIVQQDAGNSTATLVSNITLNADTRIDVNSSSVSSMNISGNITGTGKLIKGGAGTLTLNGTNTFSGGIQVLVGFLRVGSTGSIPASTNVEVATGCSFRISSNQTINDLNISAGGTLTVDAGATLTITGTYTPGTGTINNSGTIVLAGTSPQSFPGSSISITTMASLTINNASGVNMDRNLTINSAGTLTLTSGVLSIGNYTLTINGAVAGTGTLKGSSTSNLSIGGTGALGTLNFDQTTDGTTNILNNFTLNRTTSGTATLGNKLVVSGVFTPTDGTLTTGGFLHLRSNSSSTARVASLGATAAITGNVTVERYLQNKRAWRLLTSPQSNASDIMLSAGWQLQTHIVGPSGTGLDATKPSYSMMTYNTGTQAWVGVQNPTSEVQIGTSTNTGSKAFAAFITGNRSVDINDLMASSAVTLLPNASLLTGTQTYSLGSLNTNAFALVGNPYASPVDLDLVYANTGTANINRTFYTWDPSLSGTGGYVTISWNGS